MDIRNDQFLWVEKYRPRKLDDCILPSSMKTTFKEFIDSGQIPNMLLSGSAGVGKTTVARALCEQLGSDYIIINGSEESGIDVLRTKIKNFASSVSLNDKPKVVILDEADYLNPNSTQPALRGFIEEFSKNCRFIFTCNFKNRIIAPLHSRTTVIEFKIAKADKPKIAAGFYKRVVDILNTESVKFDPKVVAKVVEKHFPDYRRTLNELQRYSVSGVIDEGILTTIGETNVKNLITSLKDKDFKKMRQWVGENSDTDSTTLFRLVYDSAYEYLDGGSVPELVVILAEYQYRAAFVADQEINLVACLTDVMLRCQFK